MTDLLTQAEHRLLRPGGLSANDLERVFARLTGPSIDAADLYFQHSRSESWVLEDGIVKEGNHSIEQGVGVRALSGEKTGFAYSDEIVLPSLLEAAGSARHIGNDQRNQHGKNRCRDSIQHLHGHERVGAADQRQQGATNR